MNRFVISNVGEALQLFEEQTTLGGLAQDKSDFKLFN